MAALTQAASRKPRQSLCQRNATWRAWYTLDDVRCIEAGVRHATKTWTRCVRDPGACSTSLGALEGACRVAGGTSARWSF